MANICVIGLGKMGLPVAAFFASRGNQVIGADISDQVVKLVNEGRSPIHDEPGLEELISAAVVKGALKATTNTEEAVRQSNVVIVLVPLLVDPKDRYQPAYKYLESAMENIGKGIQRGTLVILETTLPVGDTRNYLGPIIADNAGMVAGEDFLLVFSPERVQSNQVLKNLTDYPKVVGGVNQHSTDAAVAFYRAALPPTTDVIAVPDCETAEFAKIAECVYRDVNIALANELAMCAEEAGVDINRVIAAANSEPLSNILSPGLGVGGHCIPVYPYFMINRLRQTTLAERSRQINDGMADHAVTSLVKHTGDLAGKNVLVLGLSYRANVKEPTFSSAILLVASLKQAGANVLLHDPLFSAEEIKKFGAQPLENLSDSPALAAVVVQAWHKEFHTLDWRQFTGTPVVLDGRNAVQRATVEEAGLRYLAIGLGERTA